MRLLEGLIAVVAALFALRVGALTSYLDRCKDQPRGLYPLDIHLFCGRQSHGIDPLVWLGGNFTNFLHIECLKDIKNYTCEDIPEFEFGHNDTIKELRYLDCPMKFVSIACMERRLGVRGALKLTVERPLGGLRWMREDVEMMKGWRWISHKGHGEEVTITSDALEPLSALERLELSEMRLRLAPGALAGLRALTHLELNCTRLSDRDLPPGALANLPALTHLSLSDNEIVNITYDTFQYLTSLEVLDVSYNKISSLDGALAAGCPRLREINASFNPLVELRPLQHLQQLEKLDISKCHLELELLPRALGALPHLVHVDMKWCDVRTLPADLLAGSKSLLTLDLSFNLLRALPSRLFTDQYMLQKLDLSHNELETLSQELFSGLVGLQQLDLYNNHLRKLPTTLFTNQKKLLKLDLSYNELEKLPNELFSGPEGLQWLQLNHNHLRTLPASLFSDQLMLQKMDLSYNELEALPQELFSGLTSLQCLELFHNKLRALPASLFTDQHKLQELNFCYNELITLPDELLSGLAGLQRLKLCHNHLWKLPASLFNKPMLQDLDLSYNELKKLPQEFTSLMGLQRLDLKYNYLRALSASLFTNQHKLQELHLSYNELATLPQKIFSGLAELQRLDLENNLLTELPEKFLEGLSVHVVDLTRNPLRCDCHLQHLALRTRELAGNETAPCTVFATCAAPPSLCDRSLADVDPHDLVCDNKYVLWGVLWALLTLLGLAGMLLLRHRRRRKYNENISGDGAGVRL